MYLLLLPSTLKLIIVLPIVILLCLIIRNETDKADEVNEEDKGSQEFLDEKFLSFSFFSFFLNQNDKVIREMHGPGGISE